MNTVIFVIYFQVDYILQQSLQPLLMLHFYDYCCVS